jgi:predicted ArsR family transcriptional regulator
MSDWRAIAVLADPVRRRLYEYVASCAEPVGREQAATGAEVPVHTARFHLERLVDAGLLEVSSRRISGRRGPGAGRPNRLYRRAAGDVAVSVPPREYDLVGGVLAAAVERSLGGAPLERALAEEARAAGRRDGAAAAATPAADDLDRTAGALAGRGFEPHRAEDGLELRNCPFDALAQQLTALVCGVNLDYVSGVVEGAGCRRARATLDPGEDRCCVRVVASQSGTGAS